MTILSNDEQRSLPPGEQEQGEHGATKTEVNNSGNVGTQVNTGSVETQNNTYNYGGTAPETPLEDLVENLPRLGSRLHPFRDPRHAEMRSDLEENRILLLASYQERAAYVAAHSLAHDDHFASQCKKALFLTRKRDRERTDFGLQTLAEEKLLSRAPQIILIEIGSSCTLLDSVLQSGWGSVDEVRISLENHRSYLILVINEDLLVDAAEMERTRSCLSYYTVSHLRYLLARDLADRAEEFERRLLGALEGGAAGLMDLRELQLTAAKRLEEGIAVFEEYLLKLEEAGSLPLAVRKAQFQPIQPPEVFRDGSETHQAAAFVATYFPDLGQRDFDRIVLLLLGEQKATVDRTRQVLGSDGTISVFHEQVEERWADRWRREADSVFRDTHLCAVAGGDGSWAIDFNEPYLRRELRAYLERHAPWYVKRQFEVLQESGALFFLDLSDPAVEGLVRLFVERALADPAGFGSFWLLELVRGLRIQLPGEPPPSSAPDKALEWLFERITVGSHLLAHFHRRLALLIREMLDREALRPTVQEFFEFLIAGRKNPALQHALLNLILDLARRLRFAPHFDPLIWMRRLLDQGGENVRERTAGQLVQLARESGPRIYDFLAAMNKWLPEPDRPPQRFSISNRVALEFPFAYCAGVAWRLPPEHFGLWPSRHPIFYALPSDPVEARGELAGVVEWILDPRGAALEEGDTTETMRTAEVVRIGHVADLVEHWAWVLEGGSEDGPAEGRELLRVILEEINRRTGARERAWLQRSWQRSQDEYLSQAAQIHSTEKAQRANLVARRAKLDRLRTRFAALANHQGSIGQA